MFKPITFILILFTFTTAVAATADECNNQCQNEIVEMYFNQLAKVYKQGSTDEDINSLFDSMSQHVTYEHLVYGANFNRDEWKMAFVKNHKAGLYKSESNQEIKVENRIHGKGYVAVAYSYGIRQKDGTWLPKGDQSLMAVFALENGKIVSVKEYW